MTLLTNRFHIIELYCSVPIKFCISECLYAFRSARNRRGI